MSLLEEVRIVVLCTYVCVSGLILIFSISRRLQVRDVVYSSRYVLSKTYIILGCVVAPAVVVLLVPAYSAALNTPTVVAYFLASASLLIGTAIDDSIILTKAGLVFPSTTYPTRLGWNEVTDFFVRRRNWRQRLTIIWKDESGVFRRFQFYTSRRMVAQIDRAIDAHSLTKRSFVASEEKLSNV